MKMAKKECGKCKKKLCITKTSKEDWCETCEAIYCEDCKKENLHITQNYTGDEYLLCVECVDGGEIPEREEDED